MWEIGLDLIEMESIVQLCPQEEPDWVSDLRSMLHFGGKSIEKGIVLSAAIIMRCGVLQVWVLSFLNPSLSSSHTRSGMWQQHLYECVCNENLRKGMGKLQSETNDDL